MSTDAIANLLADQFMLTVDEVKSSDGLFSNGLLDSFNLVELITTLESNFSIKIKATEVNLDNFDTVESIEKFIATKSAS